MKPEKDLDINNKQHDNSSAAREPMVIGGKATHEEEYHAEPQAIDDIPVKPEKRGVGKKIFKLALILVLSIGGLGVAGWAGLYSYNNFIAQPVADLPLVEHASSEYSLMVPEGYLESGSLDKIFEENEENEATKSRIVITKLSTIVGDRSKYIKALNDAITEDSLRKGVSGLSEEQTMSGIGFTTGSTDTQNYWRFSATLFNGEARAGTVYHMIQAGQKSTYDITVAVHATDPELDAKVISILDSVAIK